MKRIARRDQEIDRLKAEVRGLRKQLCGRKTEKGKAETTLQGLEKVSSGRRRGQQPGRVGHGRREHSHLPAVVTPADLPVDPWNMSEEVKAALRSPFSGSGEVYDSS